MHKVRPAAVAGTFYPADGLILAGDIKAMLTTAASIASEKAEKNTESAPPKAIVVPHAGYIYSGQTAAKAYTRLAAWHGKIKRIILLGPVHRVPVRGLALPDADTFETPLGEVRLDKLAIASLAGMKQVVINSLVHEQEHSLEVQLPFLQSVLDEFTLVPLAVGEATPAEVAEVLEVLWGGPETVIVVSSDLSHYLPYTMAETVDQSTVHDILNMRALLTHHQACGGTPVNGLISAARKHHLLPTLLDLCNSGDTAGDKKHVVGYASFMFTEDAGNV